MPATSNGRAEASSLLPLHSLGGNHSDEDDSDLDFLGDEDWGEGFDAFDSSRQSQKPWSRFIPWLPVPGFLRYQKLGAPPVASASQKRPWKRRVALWSLALLAFWTVFVGLFLPSYSRPPQHYKDLRKRVAASKDLGRANFNNEKVFIAASIYDKDGSLLSGAWGQNVLDLVDLLGPKNVFVSIYENDASEAASTALFAFDRKLQCEHVAFNEHLNTTDLQHVVMPDGQRLLKRIAFLAEVRNRALAPLDDPNAPIRDWNFDKLLYVNDVVFDPIDAANLLFSTNVGADGKTDFRAACATDFINPFKFYDTFATRDLEGYDMGVPFYPWFSTAGDAASRRDVLNQKDAVRVRSCWGGMVAFKGSYFQNQTKAQAPSAPSDVDAPPVTPPRSAKDEYLPARFRAEEDPFWDASECCLIHADIQQHDAKDLKSDTGIYMNPYVRVAYDTSTLSWLGFTRRFERMFSPVQRVANVIGSRPGFNPRQHEEPDQKVKDRVWVSDEKKGTGAYQDIERVAKPGGFCGGRKLLALPEDGHGGHWWSQAPPPDL